MANEKKTDILIARLLREVGIDAEPNGSRIKEVQEALATSSKRGTGNNASQNLRHKWASSSLSLRTRLKTSVRQNICPNKEHEFLPEILRFFMHHTLFGDNLLILSGVAAVYVK